MDSAELGFIIGVDLQQLLVDLLDGAAQYGVMAVKTDRNVPLQDLDAVSWQWWFYTECLGKTPCLLSVL